MILVLGFELLDLYSNFTFIMKIIIEFIIKYIVCYILLQTIFYFIPFIKRILNVLFLPFRWVHVYCHIYHVKQILKEITTKDKKMRSEFLMDDRRLFISLMVGLDRIDNNLNSLITCKRFKYAKQVVFSLNKLAFISFLGYLAITPLILAKQSGISSQIEDFIHLYFFVGIFGILMPSFNDWYIVIRPRINNLELDPKWVNLAIIVYIVFTLDILWRTYNFLLAILWGTIWFLMYIFGLFITISLARSGNKHILKFFGLPFETSRKNSELNSDTE
jgi:hypothetical protein